MKTPAHRIPAIQTLALFAALFCAFSSACAWDPMGHMLVGEIAFQKAAPRTREQVNRLVAGLDNQYNLQRPYHFVTAGCWMDDMREMRKYPWSKLHYVTIPYTPTGSAFTEPPPPHLLATIDEKLAVLKDPAATDEQRTEALGMVIHLVGDLHQPLHTTDWDDRGGNGFLIVGVPFSDLMKRQVSNLHTYWDKGYGFDGRNGEVVEVVRGPALADRPAEPGQGSVRDEAQKIMNDFPPEKLPQLGEKDFRVWTRESHTIGCLFVYPAKPHPTNAEVVKLDADYVQKARVIATERVALAGYRLARMLDELFAK